MLIIVRNHNNGFPDFLIQWMIQYVSEEALALSPSSIINKSKSWKDCRFRCHPDICPLSISFDSYLLSFFYTWLFAERFIIR